MTIKRRFEPSQEALDRVAEILHALLADPCGQAPASGDPAGLEGRAATCLNAETEG